jgi:RHS repeat-associated protein
MQEVAYDPLSGKIARRSVPVSEGTDESKMLFDAFAFDALGREVRHTSPWNAVTETDYDGLLAKVTDALWNVTLTELDPLGRPVAITDAAKGVTAYAYGPFGALYTVTDPGGALTRTTRDALGRVRQLDDPDRGTTIHVHNAFGELVSTADALGRVATFDYDGLGRTKTRIDEQPTLQTLTTTWTWDTAPNGVGKLHKVASPHGTKSYTYTSRGQLEGLALSVVAEGEIKGSLGYDTFGRVETITYPTPAGAPPFVVTQEYDPYGHVLKVRDDAVDYWRLTDVDNAGRFREEVFGNDVLTERSYFESNPRLKSVTTERGATMVQNLAYDYDARLSLKSRTDALQPQNPTERFRYDALDRLTCAYFSVKEDPFAPCASSYGYAPNGNLTFKSDIGVLSYTDPAHPHAVTAAGGKSFGYNAVGNQIKRPGGGGASYTPFDLPLALKAGVGATTTTFGYDGDQKRIVKAAGDKKTLYFGELYERVTTKAPATTAHRYFILSPERVVAVVTRGGKEHGTLYVHTDHLGSVDALTDAKGAVVERRSYDAFGQQRNSLWGQAPPGSFTSKITKGFTGHESDDELGLVNMRGRIFDPKLGRFLTTDPIVANLYDGQSFNKYAYVLNNPLSLVDPSGFQPSHVNEPGVMVMPTAHIEASPGTRPPRGPGGDPPPRVSIGPTSDAAGFGVASPPTDVDTTGSWFAPDPSLPILELPHATGPGSEDPFGIKPPALAVGYDRPLSLLEQFLSGEQSGGRTTFMLPFEPGFFRDLGIALAADDLHVVTLRPQITEFLPPSLREAALGRMAGVGIPLIAAALTPGPGDDLALAAGATGRAASGVADLAARAEQVHGALHPIAQAQRTTAVLRTSGGNIVAGGARDLSPIQKALLGPGEIVAKLPGAHAEVTALTHAQQSGLSPQAMAVTRTICPLCATAIEASGGKLTSPTTVIWP